jgi:hypothetical protein
MSNGGPLSGLAALGGLSGGGSGLGALGALGGGAGGLGQLGRLLGDEAPATRTAPTPGPANGAAPPSVPPWLGSGWIAAAGGHSADPSLRVAGNFRAFSLTSLTRCVILRIA